MKDKLYYMNILGISKLTKANLKQAYKKYSKYYHPDNTSTGNADKFIEIKEAYDYLKNKLVNKIVVNCSIDNLIGDGCKVNIEGIEFLINLNNFAEYLKLKKFIINDVKYIVRFIFIEKDGYKIIRKNRKNIIEIPLDISVENIYNGFIEKQVGNKTLSFRIPRKGYLKDTKKWNNDIDIVAKFNII